MSKRSIIVLMSHRHKLLDPGFKVLSVDSSYEIKRPELPNIVRGILKYMKTLRMVAEIDIVQEHYSRNGV
jgi:hypothetical protein